ncbi:chlorophyll a/b binding light-harvesting protein [Leptolyngbya sp. BC1307]|uniref:chlorophyll a/b binding light-harvesting protein n=1 Tax=Leptolyngbya sp. BC1307 TaxID=2029589 RepID=UPI000EFC716F|nr:chlorophyll a/b binding light-harvesting protein [Leptolyngbya sp. BC1307]
MYASSKTQERYPWWAGNARFINLSNTFIVAHVAQAALIMLWAGAFTLFELAVFSPDAPLFTQGLILLPHLATEGWGLGSDGTIVDTGVWFSIGAIHLVAAVVLAGGAYFHYTQLPASLAIAPKRAAKFDLEWQDAGKLGLILGHHLIFLGFGALLLVAKAQSFGGLYDAYSESVRLVTAPTLDPAVIWDYRTHLFDVRSLEDLVGGHIYVAGLLFVGGIWHILVPPFRWVKRFFFFSGDGILAYSLFGIAIAGFAASYYCGFDSLAYPEKFYGPTLELKSSFLPRYFEAQPTLLDGYTSRVWLANAHFYLAFFFLQGGLWHFQRAAGFDISSVLENWKQNQIAASDNPTLAYQHSELLQPRSAAALRYGIPEAKAKPWFKIEQPDEDHFYRPVQRISRPDLTAINGLEKTLYQTTYQFRKNTFYQSAKRDKSEVKALFGYANASERLYEQPEKLVTKPSAYSQPIETVVYEPKPR